MDYRAVGSSRNFLLIFALNYDINKNISFFEAISTLSFLKFICDLTSIAQKCGWTKKIMHILFSSPFWKHIHAWTFCPGQKAHISSWAFVITTVDTFIFLQKTVLIAFASSIVEFLTFFCLFIVTPSINRKNRNINK